MLEQAYVYGFREVGNLSLKDIARNCIDDYKRGTELKEFPDDNRQYGKYISYNTKNIQYSECIDLVKEKVLAGVTVVRIGNRDYYFYIQAMNNFFLP